MPSSSLFLRSSATFVSVLSLLTTPTNAYTSGIYALDTTYAGDSFFDGFDFYTDADKSHGFVTYVDEATAKSDGLIKSGEDGSVIIGVDSTNTYDSNQPYWLINGVGRPSVRITSTKKYNHGLFIADISHMPGGVCGTWPGFWTLGDGTWPYHGEIDILEGANDQTTQLSALHTAGDCSIAGDSLTETGNFQAANCTYDVNTGANGAGCGVSSTDSNSYGLDFNANNGGVYAMQWTSHYIKVWFFQRGSIPSDVEAGTPTPDAWGLPTSNFQGDCNLDANFINQQIVFDVTFCGDWAGNTWNNSCAAKTGVSSCAAYVGDNPSAFADMYWDINSVKVYQLAPPTTNYTTTSTPTTAPYSTTSGPCPAWTEGPAPPAYLTNLPSSIQSELPAWTGLPPPDWCSYTSWMKSYTSANTVYASCSAKAANNTSYTFPTTTTTTTTTGNYTTPTGSYTTPTGSYTTPTGSYTTLTGSYTTPTGSYSTPTGSTTTTTGTWFSGTATDGAWSAWSTDPVTYSGTSPTSSFPLTTGWAQSSLAAPPMGGDGNNAGIISAGGTAYSWGSATSTDPASETTTTWASWTDPSTPTAWTSSTLSFTYTKTSWTYDPASSSIYWSWVGSSLTTTAPSTWTTSSTPSVAYDPTAWSSTLAVATATASSASWEQVDPTATGPQIAPFTGAASAFGMSAMGYVAVAVMGLLVVIL